MNRYGVALATAGLGGLLNAGDATACGGCFAPPSTVQVVTDHRMVLSVSPTQTTLWDQFRYSGNPAEFSWILPIRYSDAVHVQIADNAFLQFADDISAPVVTPPTRPRPPFCANTEAPGTLGGGGAASDAGVVVHLEEVVGPYAVAIIGGGDPMAIRNWLTTNGYSVPPSVIPVIDYYTGLHMDYVALRLRPGEGISQMSPVRVTMPGYIPTLPMRMISAGVADHVGLSLIVVAPSRMEAQNFPNGSLAAGDLTYDFNRPNNPAADFLAAFASHNQASMGRLWLTESAMTQQRTDWAARVVGYIGRGGGPGGGPGGRPDAGMVGDAGAPTNPVDDVNVAFTGLGDRATVTRLRADLPVSALDRDLSLSASDLGLLSNQYTYGHVLNTPVYPPCPDAGRVDYVDAGSTDAVAVIDPGADGGAAGTGGTVSMGGVHCTAAPWGTGSGQGGGVALGLLAGVAVTVAARRRREG